jgi:hypothetical protein
MLHSFRYAETEQAFRDILAQDPFCVVATWGIAAILMSNPLAGISPSPPRAERAQAASDQGRKIGAKTQRERDYIDREICVPREPLFGMLERFVGLAHLSGQSERIALDHAMHEVKEIERFVSTTDDLAYCAMGNPVLFPGLCCLDHRRLQHLHHASSGRGRTAHLCIQTQAHKKTH